MIYGSVCSGIEAATMAWHPLGWTPAFFSEIEKFPSAVLAHHYGSNMPGEPASTNGVPNYGDMTKFKEWPDHAIDLLVGGTPCQSFSVAGLRKGLADPRGNLMLTYLAIARRYQPRWLVWENVPGVLSSGEGRDFGALLTGLAELGYGFAWRVLDAQYVRVDGYDRAVPQRRRRVFVVGYLGDWRRAAAVFLEREGLLGNSPPRRQSREGTPGAVGDGVSFSGQSLSVDGVNGVSATLDTGAEHHNRGIHVAQPATPYTLAIRGRDGKPDLEYRQDGTANAILTPNGGRAGIGVGAIAHPTHDVVGTLCAEASPHGARGLTGLQTMLSGYIQPMAFAQNSRDEVRLFGGDGQVVGALSAEPGMKQTTYVSEGWAVRRLTPTECERLQGFPDGFTDIQPNGKPTPDGPRYKALGNSMAVNAMRWIGRRIEMVEAITAKQSEAA